MLRVVCELKKSPAVMGFLLYISQLACWQPCSSVYGCQDACLHLRAGSSCEVLEENTQQVVVDTCSKYFIYKAFVIWATTEELNWAIYSRTKLDQTTVAYSCCKKFTNVHHGHEYQGNLGKSKNCVNKF